MKLAALLALLLLLTACSDPQPTNVNPPADSTVTKTTMDAAPSSEQLPPGFTDTPPPPPTSDTLVLSGGTLVLAEPIDDSVVVIQNNTILAWGQRGQVDLPNDSIGMDMRGKWIIPGVPADVTTSSLDSTASLQQGAAASLLVFSADPLAKGNLAEVLHAIVTDEGIEVFATESD
jgi:hypothetical protein